MEIEIGQIWRKDGPADWFKIVGIQMPGKNGYDGGLPGVSVKTTNINGNWKRQRLFWPAVSSESFIKDMEKHNRRLVT